MSPRLTDDPFRETCCDGGECPIGYQSAQPCGCDMGCKTGPYYCELHRLVPVVRQLQRENAELRAQVRKFRDLCLS